VCRVVVARQHSSQQRLCSTWTEAVYMFIILNTLALTCSYCAYMQALDRAGVLVADISASSGQVSLRYTVHMMPHTVLIKQHACATTYMSFNSAAVLYCSCTQ
jgi:hypothetical protein